MPEFLMATGQPDRRMEHPSGARVRLPPALWPPIQQSMSTTFKNRCRPPPLIFNLQRRYMAVIT